MVNLFVGFEYQTKNSTNWQQLGTKQFWTDQEITNLMNQNNRAIAIENVPGDVARVRAKLMDAAINNPNDPNNFVKFTNFPGNNINKFISNIVTINPTKITFDSQ